MSRPDAQERRVNEDTGPLCLRPVRGMWQVAADRRRRLPLFHGLDEADPSAPIPPALEEPEVLELRPCPLGEAPEPMEEQS